MVYLETVINELNTGKIEFKRTENQSFCTTEGELVLLLEKLKRLRAEINPWFEYPDIYPDKEGFYWITYKVIDIDGKETVKTTKELYSEKYHAFMGHDRCVMAWKKDIPFKNSINHNFM